MEELRIVLRELMDARANLNSAPPAQRGHPALSVAALNDHPDVVRLLLATGAAVNAPVEDGHHRGTTLWAVVRVGVAAGTSTLQILLQAKAAVNLGTHYEKETPLLAAVCHADNVVTVQALLQAKADLNLTDSRGQSALWRAARYGHTSSLRVLLQARAAVDQAEMYRGDTALLAAAQHGHRGCVRALLQGGAAVDQPGHWYGFDQERLTPLLAAADCGELEIVRALLQAKATVNVEDPDDLSALLTAVKCRHVGIVQELVRAKATANGESHYREAPLHVAVENDDCSIVQVLLQADATVHAMDFDGVAPLCKAAELGLTGTTRALLEAKAQVNYAGVNCNFATPLWNAAARGHSATVHALLKAKAFVNVPDAASTTPLWKASENGHVGVARALLEAKARVDYSDAQMCSSLLAAARGGRSVEVVHELLLAKADVDEPDIAGMTPLATAAFKGHVGVVKALLQARAAANAAAADMCNRSPLVCATLACHISNACVQAQSVPLWAAAPQHRADFLSCTADIVLALLEAKADVHAKADDKDRFPLWLAASHGHVEAVRVLLLFKAVASRVGRFGQTPVQVASARGHSKVVALLLAAQPTTGVAEGGPAKPARKRR